MKLSPDQEQALEQVGNWLAAAPLPVYETEIRNGKQRSFTVGTAFGYPVCSVGGYAGTGKTTILRYAAESNPNAVLVTPTHKAAQVLRSKLPGSMGARVRTFHSLIYSPDPRFTCGVSNQEMMLLDSDDEEEHVLLSPCNFHVKVHNAVDDSLCDPKEHLKFVKRQQLQGMHDLIIVDEASMLTEQEVNDLRSFGLPVLLVGDHGQLPPVKAKMNPWIASPKITLTVNHRQGEESGIPAAAVDARNDGVLRECSYGSAARVLSVRDPAVSGLLDRFRPDARNYTFLVQYNRTRAALNQMFHDRQYGEQTLAPGDRIISLERQEEAQELDDAGNVVNETLIHNGTLATVTAVLTDGPRYSMIEAELDNDWRGNPGTKVLLKVATEQFGKPEQLSFRTKPHGAALWDYAYALTAHKAQGSEFDNVIVWQETPGDKRWLYTAVTRAKQALIVLT